MKPLDRNEMANRVELRHIEGVVGLHHHVVGAEQSHERCELMRGERISAPFIPSVVIARSSATTGVFSASCAPPAA
jgi:hypothetical protein